MIKMINKRISLITTTRDRPYELLTAGLSVAKQQVVPHEWIIYIDDDMKKYSEVLAKLTALIPQLKVISKGKVGRNRALILAHQFVTSHYVGWLDDDDTLTSDCLKYVTEAPGKLIYTDFIDSRNPYQASELSKPAYSFSRMLRNQLLFHFVCYDYELYQKVGGIDPSFDTSMDFELYARMAIFETPTKINLPLYYYNHRADSISGKYGKRQRENHIRAVRKLKEILLHNQAKNGVVV